MFALILTSALAGEITVTETAGAELAAVGEPTVLKVLPEHDKAEGIALYEVLSESTVYAAGSAGTIAGGGSAFRSVCNLPCSLELSPGPYRFRVGEAPALARNFTVTATGGTQRWSIRDERPGKWIYGFIATTFGLTGVAMGVPFLLLLDDPIPWAAVTASSAVLTITGIPALSKGAARARRLD